MRLPQTRPRTAIVAAATFGVLAAVGVAVGVTATGSSRGAAAGAPSPAPTAVLRVMHLHHHHRLPYRKPLVVRVTNGILTSVSVSEPTGQQIPGSYNATHDSWQSAGSFAPLTQLHAHVTYTDLAHHLATKDFDLRATDAKHRMTALLSPGGGDTVGVGSPIQVSFNYDVPTKLRSAVEGRLSVVTHPKVVGAWHWMSAREVHWRPPSYWQSGTRVTISSDLQGIDFGHGIWGDAGSHRTSFRIGDAHVSEVDIATHTMHVYDNGQLIKTFPVSTGRDQYPTMDGVHIAIEKSKLVVMDSATVGIPKGNPDYYHETVYWDVRISDGGEFVHAAPWSVADQGNTNVSHGCVNLSTVNAEWFYNWATRGDIIYVFNGVRPPSPTDPGTADWNMSWKQWLAGDAAPTRAAKALHPQLPSSYQPAFTPPQPKASKKTKAAAGQNSSKPAGRSTPDTRRS
ncbi:MAG TPA: Ig-like domain-containing protein [Mycobacteriales bacterium]|nr:Ig-like domain-containing protein [Mycobacteriales bacterium]